MTGYIRKDNCRICGGSDLQEILDLGSMPPANAFIKSGRPVGNEKFPLSVYFFNNCFLLQVPDVVDPEILFKDYDYTTSASKPLVDHFNKSANILADRFLKKDDLVVEIGVNDGTLLSAIKNRCKVLNIEPAENIADISRQKGIETISRFFGD